jgi:hypothetical protein
MKDIFNVICIKWGALYSPDYVNKLCRMVKRNTNYEVNFYCFTEDSESFDKDIIVKPLPNLDTIEDFKHIFSYKKEAALCDDNLGGLNGQRVFFLDLDMVAISNLDKLFEYPKGDKFYIINDWHTKGDNVGQASCYSWVVGTIGSIKADYEKNPKWVLNKFGSAAQEYLSYKVIEKFGKLNFWPENWFYSFKFHCMPKFILARYFIEPKIPANSKDLKFIAFHGTPNPDEAIEGRWEQKAGKSKWKQIYKVCRPTSWITKYWY